MHYDTEYIYALRALATLKTAASCAQLIELLTYYELCYAAYFSLFTRVAKEDFRL